MLTFTPLIKASALSCAVISSMTRWKKSNIFLFLNKHVFNFIGKNKIAIGALCLLGTQYFYVCFSI